jgi:hypothetical protein
MSFTISAVAYAKIKLHAFKYPHCEVTGILLADRENPRIISDVVPLFHQGTKLLPMIEVAFQQVEKIINNPKFLDKNEFIVGYYEIPVLVSNTVTISPFAQRIGDKINQIQISDTSVTNNVDSNSTGDDTLPENTKLDQSDLNNTTSNNEANATHDASGDTKSSKKSSGKTVHSTLILSMHNPSGKFQFFVKKYIENNAGTKSYSDVISNQKWSLEDVAEEQDEQYNEYEDMVDHILKDRLHLELHDFDNWLDNSKEFDFMNIEFMKLLKVYTC